MRDREEDRLLHPLRAGEQEVHRPVQLVVGDRLDPVEDDVAAEPAGRLQLRGRLQAALADHREDRPLHPGAAAAAAGDPRDRLADPELAPQRVRARAGRPTPAPRTNRTPPASPRAASPRRRGSAGSSAPAAPAPPGRAGPRGRSCGSPAPPARRARCARCAPTAGSAPARPASSASPSPADTRCLHDDTTTGQTNSVNQEKRVPTRFRAPTTPKPLNQAKSRRRKRPNPPTSCGTPDAATPLWTQGDTRRFPFSSFGPWLTSHPLAFSVPRARFLRIHSPA